MTGDRKKGHHTDHVKRQYIGNLGKIENGIVAVTAYWILSAPVIMPHATRANGSLRWRKFERV